MKEQSVFIGNCTTNGIYQYKIKKGKLTKIGETKDYTRSTFLTQNEDYVYSVLENKKGYVVAYKKIDDELLFLNKKLSGGEGPCHIEINKKSKLIFVSNYINGYLSIFKIKEDGSIGKNIFSRVEKENSSHLHCVKTEKNGRFFFAIDLGENLIIAYELIKNKIKKVDTLKLKENTQPRHLVLNKDILYVITEKSCEIYSIKFIKKKLKVINTISLLPKGIEKKEDYTGCAIKITKNFKYLYATVRGHNSVSVYKVNNEKVKMIQSIFCGGNSPRDLEIDKNEKFILVANLEDNQISVFKRNKITGKIKYKRKELIESPTCIVIK